MQNKRGRPAEGRKNKQVGIILPSGIIAAIQIQAEAEGRTFSGMVHRILAEALREAKIG